MEIGNIERGARWARWVGQRIGPGLCEWLLKKRSGRRVALIHSPHYERTYFREIEIRLLHGLCEVRTDLVCVSPGSAEMFRSRLDWLVRNSSAYEACIVIPSSLERWALELVQERLASAPFLKIILDSKANFPFGDNEKTVYVSFDNRKGAGLLRTHLADEPDLVIFGYDGVSGDDSVRCDFGRRTTFVPCATDRPRDSAFREAIAFLKNQSGQLTAPCVCLNDDIALGVDDAVQAIYGGGPEGRVRVYSFDCSQSVQERIAEYEAGRTSIVGGAVQRVSTLTNSVLDLIRAHRDEAATRREIVLDFDPVLDRSRRAGGGSVH